MQTVTEILTYNQQFQKEFHPVKYFSIDRVFRNENIDDTHLAEFHQIEGVVADYGLTLGDLMGIIYEFFKKLGIERLRFKPAYNPYTEPSMEIFSYHDGKMASVIMFIISIWEHLVAIISEIGYLLLPTRDVAERLLKQRKSSKQPTNQQEHSNRMVALYDFMKWINCLSRVVFTNIVTNYPFLPGKKWL